MPKPVSVSLTANASGLVSAFSQASASSRSMASQVQASGTKAQSAMDKAAAGAKRLAIAERLAANAAGSVRLAEAHLQDVRAKSTASASQRIAAEESLYKASRRLAAAQQQVSDRADEMRGKSFLGGIEANSADIDRVGSSLLKVGAAGAAGLGLVAKAAIDWESDWAGVTKTVDGTAPQLAELEGQLRGLARTLPESHHEIAAVAEAAGQLGVKRQDVSAFTKTMIELGDTTNLSSEEAATSMAQLMNIMGTAPSRVGALGDTLVKLGNNGASTERDILQMGQRIAGAGKQVDLTENQVLAFASAVTSTGIEVEAGGTSMSQTFQKIDKSVRQGGSALDTIAKTSGISAKEYTDAWGRDAGQATLSFVDGLARVKRDGGSAATVLDSLGIKGARQQDVLLRLAGATKVAGAQTDLLADSLRDADQAQGALSAEAEKRYSTDASKIKIALNKIQDDAITTGAGLLPMVSQVTDGIGKWADGFQRLSPQTQGFLAKGAAVGTAAALMGGGLLTAASNGAQLYSSLRNLSVEVPNLSGRLKGAAVGVAAITGALAAMQIAGQFLPKFQTDMLQATNALTAAGNGDTTDLDAMFKIDDTALLLGQIDSLGSALQQLNAGGFTKFASELGKGVAEISGLGGSQLQEIEQVFTGLDTTLAGYTTSGNADKAAQSFAQIRKEADLQRFPLEKLIDLFPQYSKSMMGVAEQAGVTALSQEELADWMGGKVPAAVQKAAAGNSQLGAAVDAVTGKVTQQKKTLDQLLASLQATANLLLQQRGGQVGMEAAIDAATASLKENGRTLDVHTEKGRQNRTALDNIAVSTASYTAAQVKNGASAESIVNANERGRASFISSARAMGMGRKAATDLAGSLFRLPKSVTSQVVVAGAKVSKKEARDLNDEIHKLPKEQRARIVTIAETKGAKAARQAMAEVKDKQVIARSKKVGTGAEDVKKSMDALKDRLVEAKARGDKKGAQQVAEAMRALKDRQVVARVKADTSGIQTVRTALATVHGKVVTVTIKRNTINSGDDEGSTGGLITHAGFIMRGPLRRSNGGPVWGAGTATSDSIDARLSNGEFVQSARATSYYGTSAMTAINARRVPKEALAGYRYGGAVSGTVGVPHFAVGGSVRAVTTTDILRLIRELQDPVDDIGDLFRKLSAANRKVTKPKARYDRAVAAYDKAVDRRDDVRDRVNRLRREADATKGVTKADRDLKKARADLADANARVSKTSKEKSAATTAYNKVADKTKALTSELTDAQKALADAARQVSDGFRELYTSKSTDPRDWIALMKEGSADLTAFNAKIAKLRKSGLSETLVQQIVDMGAGAGSDVADQIAAGGRAMVSSLNQANSQLQQAADNLGYQATTAPVRHATGGPVSGPGTGTSDSIRARLSNGEWVVPAKAAAVPANRRVLADMTYGSRRVVERNYAHTYAYGGPVYSTAPSSSTTDNSMVLNVHGDVIDPEKMLRKANLQRRDALVKRGLSRRAA